MKTLREESMHPKYLSTSEHEDDSEQTVFFSGGGVFSAFGCLINILFWAPMIVFSFWFFFYLHEHLPEKYSHWRLALSDLPMGLFFIFWSVGIVIYTRNRKAYRWELKQDGVLLTRHYASSPAEILFEEFLPYAQIQSVRQWPDPFNRFAASPPWLMIQPSENLQVHLKSPCLQVFPDQTQLLFKDINPGSKLGICLQEHTNS